MVNPSQPNQICCTVADLEAYLRDVVIPDSVASENKFKARPNVPVAGLNTTTKAIAGYVPRGTLLTHAPIFKRIGTQYLIMGPDPCAVEKSPSARTTEPSTTSPSSEEEENYSVEAPLELGSPHSVGSASIKMGGLAQSVGSEAILEEQGIESPGRSTFFSWFSCYCVPPEANPPPSRTPSGEAP
jgi:hypothetical protein